MDVLSQVLKVVTLEGAMFYNADAKESGVSRSVLAERFRHFLDAPPMTYLTGWRLQLGARLLCSTNRSVAQVAAEVGYESEPAFNRAFKRAFGAPPARFRSQSRRPLRPGASRPRRLPRPS